MTDTKKTPLTFLLLAAALLTIVGFIFIYSSSSVYAFERYHDSLYYFKKQVIGSLLGLCVFMAVLCTPLALIKRSAPLIYLATVLLTLATLVPGLGVTIHGSTRWLKLGGFLFQPSELLKVGTILYCAYFLEKREFSLHSLVRTYIPFLIVLGITAGTLLLQPDFGHMVTIGFSALLLGLIAGIPTFYVALSCIPAVLMLGLLIFLKSYRLRRIMIYFNPWQDPQGAGFQIIQSLIAIGSGHIAGVGIAQSKQKFFYLPMHHTDFIFSIIAEESGFIGVCIILLLYLVFLFAGFKLSLQHTNQFSRLCIMGFTLVIIIQALVNISVASALLPAKGIGLPFISYGASSLLAHFCMLGILTKCALTTKS